MSIRFVSIVIAGLFFAAVSDGAPYQELEPRDGYVPVYIREGDTPLLDINPKLAEAFNEIDSKNLIEQVDVASELEKKPDLILMTVDNGEAVLSIPSEEQPAEVIEIIKPETSESDMVEMPQPSDRSDDIIEDSEIEQSAEAEKTVLEQAKDTIKDLVSVLEIEMMKKITEAASERQVDAEGKREIQPVVEPVVEEQAEGKVASVEEQPLKEVKEEPLAAAVKPPTESILEVSEIKEELQLPEQLAVKANIAPEDPALPAIESEDKTNQKDASEDNDKPEDPATDVSSIDDFKIREIDVKSIETEKTDVPEETHPDTVSTEE